MHLSYLETLSVINIDTRKLSRLVRDSIEAHLSIVVAAMAVSHYIEHQTGWRIEKFVRTSIGVRHFVLTTAMCFTPGVDLRMIDAPVSGSQTGALNARLMITSCAHIEDFAAATVLRRRYQSGTPHPTMPTQVACLICRNNRTSGPSQTMVGGCQSSLHLDT
jgi:hypothetical protein